ncbi:nuclear transport factor 2 family protein [Serratia silvae]|uniref:Nuclear transport factor 2 family protein n=1 Tax=Serratia silvae TaxID=2824122 RepID=A0ABT0KAQ7_9GAMM|nr:nuclear transport factor 2 family protein [Serratia silvae]MCL1029124.1 nuclear transport factor 2 family protein [Serratia silvae]
MNDIAQLLPVIQSHWRFNSGELLHDDFEEIDCSGQHYDRQQTIAALKLESGQSQIFAEEFKLVTITDGAVLLRYKIFQRDADGSIVRHADRSSIWLQSSQENGGHWQMRFHQGTQIED